MRTFTTQRGSGTTDECWFLQHHAVFTLGLNSQPEHMLSTGNIPVEQSDRGGQVTYHGPGQLIMYPLLDLKRLGLSVSALVHLLEVVIIEWLAEKGVTAESRADAPGVYVDGAKLASLGLRVKRGRCYHGLSLNVNMDLEPFSRINPCGYPGLPVTQLANLGISDSIPLIIQGILPLFASRLGYTVRL